MGRHKGASDPILAERVRRARDQGGPSLSELARGIGVAPSTLSRATKSQRFSAELRRRLDARLGVVASVDTTDGLDLGASLRETLRLMAELRNLMPDLERRLIATLDQRHGLGQTTD